MKEKDRQGIVFAGPGEQGVVYHQKKRGRDLKERPKLPSQQATPEKEIPVKEKKIFKQLEA